MMLAGIGMPLPPWSSGEVLQRLRDLQAEGSSYRRHEVSIKVNNVSRVLSRGHLRLSDGDGGSLYSTPRILLLSHEEERTQDSVHTRGTSEPCAYS